MKAKWILISLMLILANTGFGQKNKESQKPIFNYQDIEEIKKTNLEKLKDKKLKEIVIYTKWDIGGYKEFKSKNVGIENPFDIYVLWIDENGKSKILQIDNFGEKKEDEINLKEMEKYLSSNFNEMKSDYLSPKKEKIKFKGKIIEAVSPMPDHELEYQISIIFSGEELNYKYRPSWSANEVNLQKKQFLFIEKLDGTVKEK